jgi:hypothetical protein
MALEPERGKPMHGERHEAILTQERDATAEALPQERAGAAAPERSLRTQRAELLLMIAELKQLQEVVRARTLPELEAQRRENQQLRLALAEKEHAPDVPSMPASVTEELERLRGEVALLRNLLQEKDALVEELQRRHAPSNRSRGDLETYEAELNDYRKQLEDERAKVAEEREQQRLHRQELDEATREMEMELSRERAELARERTRLERLRDDARTEMERFQRDAGVLNRLAPVQRLREELNGNQ